jgi:hypothetical protein
MKILKGMALGFAGFFLFISLPYLGLIIALKATLLNPDFVVKEIEKLDVTEIARDYIKKELPAEALTYSLAIDDTLTQEKPWINQQISISVYSVYDYLLDRTDSLTFKFNLEEVKENLSANIVNSIVKSPPPEYQSLSSQDKVKYLADLKPQIQAAIPSNYVLEVNQSLIGQQGMNSLNEVKNIIGSIHTAFWMLFVFVIIMILLIVVIQREVRGSTRVLGIIFLADGFLSGVTYFVLKMLIPVYLNSFELPERINSWINNFSQDLLFPWSIFSLVVLIIGLTCLVLSLIIRGNPVYSNKSLESNP